MKSLRLSELKRKKSGYYKNIGVVTQGRRKKSTIEYIVQRSYDALPKNLKKYIEDSDQIQNVLVNTILQAGKSSEVNPYEAMKQYALHRQKSSGDNTKKYLYKRLKSEEPRIYNKYNTYVYRLGYSAMKWFMDNVELDQDGSIIKATVELPQKLSGVKYDFLTIRFDFSGDDFEADMQ